jgi:ubiquinone/menaquinone biosynthesis C-methylase UbiE
MKSRERVKRGFNRISSFYDAAAFIFFGRSLWKAQSHFLKEVPRCSNALIIGGGTGRILEEMMRLNIADHYYYLDISDRMVKRARQRAERNFKERISSVTFHAGTAHDLPSSSFDLILTPFMLDMIEKKELQSEMRSISSHLNKNGLWLFTDFNHPKQKGSRIFSSFLIGLLYFFFGAVTGVKNRSLPDFASAFSTLRFDAKKEKYFLGGVLVSRIYQRSDK